MTLDAATLVEVVIGITLLEAAALVALYRRDGRGVAPRDWSVNLLSGVCLLLALRCQIGDAGVRWVAFWLTAAGAAHAADLTMRWRGARPTTPPFDEVSA